MKTMFALLFITLAACTAQVTKPRTYRIGEVVTSARVDAEHTFLAFADQAMVIFPDAHIWVSASTGRVALSSSCPGVDFQRLSTTAVAEDDFLETSYMDSKGKFRAIRTELQRQDSQGLRRAARGDGEGDGEAFPEGGRDGGGGAHPVAASRLRKLGRRI